MPDPTTIKPLRLVVPETVQEQFDEAVDLLETLKPPFGGEEAAERFLLTLNRQMPSLCQDIAERMVSGSNLPVPMKKPLSHLPGLHSAIFSQPG